MRPDTVESKMRSESGQRALTRVESISTELDIDKELDALHRSPKWQSGLARKILIRYPDFLIILRAMKANMQIPEHYSSGRISVQTVQGHIRMHAGGRLFDLPEGKALVLDREVIHDVEAVEDSAFLLTVVFPESTVS